MYSFFIGSIISLIVIILFAFYKNHVHHHEIVNNWNYVETMQFYKDHPIGFINWGFFLYVELSSAIGFHPLFLSMYYVVAILFGFVFLDFSTGRNMKIAIIILMILLALAVLMLNSKAGIIALILLLLCQFVFSLLRSRLFGMKRIILSFCLLFMAVLPMAFPVVRYRLVNSVKVTQELFKSGVKSTDSNRVQIWGTAVELIKKNDYSGYGLFGGRKALTQSFEGQGLEFYNTHNQYLMFALTGGAVVLLLFMLSQFVLFYSAVRFKDVTYALFLVTIVVVMLTENILNRQKGVLLFGFFNTLFYLCPPLAALIEKKK